MLLVSYHTQFMLSTNAMYGNFLATRFKNNIFNCGKATLEPQYLVIKQYYKHNIQKYSFTYSHIPQVFPQTARDKIINKI